MGWASKGPTAKVRQPGPRGPLSNHGRFHAPPPPHQMLSNKTLFLFLTQQTLGGHPQATTWVLPTGRDLEDQIKVLDRIGGTTSRGAEDSRSLRGGRITMAEEMMAGGQVRDIRAEEVGATEAGATEGEDTEGAETKGAGDTKTVTEGETSEDGGTIGETLTLLVGRNLAPVSGSYLYSVAGSEEGARVGLEVKVTLMSTARTKAMMVAKRSAGGGTTGAEGGHHEEGEVRILTMGYVRG